MSFIHANVKPCMTNYVFCEPYVWYIPRGLSLTKGRIVEPIPVADDEIDIGEPLDTSTQPLDISIQSAPVAETTTVRHNGAIAVRK